MRGASSVSRKTPTTCASSGIWPWVIHKLHGKWVVGNFTIFHMGKPVLILKWYIDDKELFNMLIFHSYVKLRLAGQLYLGAVDLSQSVYTTFQPTLPNLSKSIQILLLNISAWYLFSNFKIFDIFTCFVFAVRSSPGRWFDPRQCLAHRVPPTGRRRAWRALRLRHAGAGAGGALGLPAAG